MMNRDQSLQRFIDAQETDYAIALAEVKLGSKRSHWMWYIFPQILGLGFSETSRYYATKDQDEAAIYLKDPVLGTRLAEISNALLQLESSNGREIFGSSDDMKLKSSMTLFATMPGADPVFGKVLNKFFGGAKDEKTLQIIGD